MNKLKLSSRLRQVLRDVRALGGTVYLAGGGVRDFLLDLPVKDLDFEVYGMSPDVLKETLEKRGHIQAVGKSFGVYLMSGENAEFALPRRENKRGRGHKGFIVEFDPTMTTYAATLRRDFTINSMLMNLGTGDIIDHHGGKRDLSEHVLRATSVAYKEDPLRVLRGMQFISRFDLVPTTHTIHMSREMLDEAETLSKERIWWEWYKWAAYGYNLSAGLTFLEDTEWIFSWPVLERMRLVEQDPDWHPEGDVWVHTGITVNNAAWVSQSAKLSTEQRLVQVFAALLHDVGKRDTAEISKASGRIIHPKHEVVSADLAEDFLGKIGAPQGLIEQVVPLVREHMFRRGKKPEHVTSRSVRRLALRLKPATVQQLTMLMTADVMGRRRYEVADHAIAHQLNVVAAENAILDSQPQPIIKGRHLIIFGLTPGPSFGPILKDAFEAQLEGEFDDKDTASVWLTGYLGR